MNQTSELNDSVIQINTQRYFKHGVKKKRKSDVKTKRKGKTTLPYLFFLVFFIIIQEKMYEKKKRGWGESKFLTLYLSLTKGRGRFYCLDKLLIEMSIIEIQIGKVEILFLSCAKTECRLKSSAADEIGLQFYVETIFFFC